MEQIPDYIFDWIETTPFEQLTAQQQAQVQHHLPQEEYNQMHQAALLAAGYMQQGKENIEAKNKALSSLHTVFDAVHPAPQIPQKTTSLWVWKAAASLLLLAVAFLSYGLYNAKHVQQHSRIAITPDTVYVNITKEVPHEVKIYDTVYLQPKTQNKVNKKATPFGGSTPLPKDISPNISPLRQVPFADRDQPQNSPKHNSLKDDTLAQNFNFVSL